MTRHGERTLLCAAAVALLVAACSTAAGPSGPPPSAPPGGAVIVAQGLAFDRSRLEIPAGTSSPLLFENREGVPHNVTILDKGGSPLFVGETFNGSGSRTYSLPALTSGVYRFRCDVHPDMAGTLIANP